MGWRTIETAPRDGTWVLVFGETRAGKMARSAQWMDDFGGVWITAVADHGKCRFAHHLRVRDVTDWQPLPEPPEAQDKIVHHGDAL